MLIICDYLFWWVIIRDYLFKFCSYKLFISWRYYVMSKFKIVTCHFSFLISHFSYKAKAFGKSFKGVKNVYYQYYKSFNCGENFDKKIFFLLFSVLDKIRLSSRSATTLISQQPWKHKAAATLISNHKLQNNCSLKKYISEHKYKNYVNSCEFIDNKWCFNNKKCFYCY